MPIAQIPEKGEIKAGFSVFHLKKLVEPQKFNPSLQNYFKTLKYFPKTNKNVRENLTATKFEINWSKNNTGDLGFQSLGGKELMMRPLE